MIPYYSDEYATLFHAKAEEVLGSLEDASVDMVLTDPPYGHNQNEGDLSQNREKALGIPKTKREAISISGDGFEDAQRWIALLALESSRLLRQGGCCCCCCSGGGPDPQFARWALKLDDFLKFKQQVVWDKGGLGLGWHYRRNYEVVLVAEKAGGPTKWYGGNDVPNLIRIPGRKAKKGGHPTPKPVELGLHFIRLHSQKRDVVLDPFCGAGTFGVAAKMLKRRYIGCDVDERWLRLAAESLAATSSVG